MPWLISFLLFILPIIVLPFGISWFETPKVITAEIVIEILFIYFLLKGQIKLSGFNIAFVALFSLSLLGLLDHQNFFGNVFRLQGVFLFWHLLIFSILSANIKLYKNSSLLSFFVLVILLLSVFILGGDLNGRAFGTLGEANALAASALFLLPFALFIKSRITKFAALLITFWIVFASGSYSGFLGLLIEITFLLIIKYFRLSLLKAAVVCLVLIGFSLFLPFLKGGWFENRAEIWKTASYSGLNSPIIGHGINNITESLKKASILLNNNIKYQFIDSSHNFLLDFWVQGGLIGLGSILLILFSSFKHLTEKNKIIEITALLGIITAMLFNPASVVTLVAFWWLIGQGFSDN